MPFSGKSQYDVPTCKNTIADSAFHCINRILISMSSIDTTKCSIIRTLNTILHQQESMLINLFQIMKQGIRHTIRPGTDHKSDNVVNAQRFFIFSFQGFQLTVSISIRLEVSKVLHLRILMGKEYLPFFQLLGNGLFRTAILRIESLVVAVSTTTISL